MNELNRLPLRLISTDFDGTLFAEFENPPIPERLQHQLAQFQAGGGKWVINTGRDMSSLMEALGRSGVDLEPDFLVLVEREIYQHRESQYLPLGGWNHRCTRDHAELFARIQPELPRIIRWINDRCHARIYEDAFSPLCLIAGNNGDMDVLHAYLEDFCRTVPDLTIVRNDVYARFSHAAYNKGTALAEITRHLGLDRTQVFAAGDHLNDLPMLSTTFATHLAAPTNAVDEVKRTVRAQNGFVSELWCGHGIAEALGRCLGG